MVDCRNCFPTPNQATAVVVRLPYYTERLPHAPHLVVPISEATSAHVRGLVAESANHLEAEAWAPALLTSLRAMLVAVGVVEHDQVISDGALVREGGRLVVRGAYPSGLSAYAAGHVGGFTVARTTALDTPACAEYVRRVLVAQRTHVAHQVAALVQANPNTARTCVRTGQPYTVAELRPTDWECMTWRFGYTTLLDVLHQRGPEVPKLPVKRLVRAFQAVHATYVEGAHAEATF